MTEETTVRRGPLLVALVLGVSVVLMGTTILNVAIPQMQKSLGTSNAGTQWILNSYTLAFAGFLLLSGAVADRFGYRRVLLGALALFTVAAAIGAAAQDAALLIAMRTVMGIAAAGIMPTTLAVINRAVPESGRAAAITTWAAFSGLSIALGPLLGGALLTAGLWWGSVLALVAVLSVTAFLITWKYVPELPGTGRGGIRMVPVLVSIAGISLLVWGVLNGGEDNQWAGLWTLAPIIAGAGLLAWLVVMEMRHARPMADVRLFGNGLFAFSTFVLAVGTFAVYGFLYVTTFYLELARGYDPLMTGVALIPLPVALIIAAPLSRSLTERVGPRAVMSAGMAVTAAGMSLIAFIDADSAIGWFALVTFAVAFGFGLVLSPGTAAAMSAVPPSRAGAGSALLNTLRQIGSALGFAVLGSLLWAGYRTRITPQLGDLPASMREEASASLAGTLRAAHLDPGLAEAGRHAFDHAMHTTGLIGAGVCLLGALAVLLTVRRRPAGQRANQAGEQECAVVDR